MGKAIITQEIRNKLHCLYMCSQAKYANIYRILFISLHFTSDILSYGMGTLCFYFNSWPSLPSPTTASIPTSHDRKMVIYFRSIAVYILIYIYIYIYISNKTYNTQHTVVVIPPIIAFKGMPPVKSLTLLIWFLVLNSFNKYTRLLYDNNGPLLLPRTPRRPTHLAVNQTNINMNN